MMKILLLIGTGFLISCSVVSTRDNELVAEDNSPRVDPKYSLAKDRTELDKLREAVPVETKKANDEKAFLLELMAEYKYAPEVVRDKFQTMVKKKRDIFNKDISKQRDAYNKAEKKNRDEFLKRLSDERKEFLKERVESEKRADFFNEQDETRRNYFSDQRDKREEFESETREKRKDFEDYIKEKQDEFAAELRNYTVKWNEIQKQKNEQ